MALVKIGAKHQIVIPKAVFAKMGLAPGDYVDVSANRGHAVIKLKKAVNDFPETDERLGPKMRASINRALKDVEAGRVFGPFHTAEELLAHLASLKKRGYPSGNFPGPSGRRRWAWFRDDLTRPLCRNGRTMVFRPILDCRSFRLLTRSGLG